MGELPSTLPIFLIPQIPLDLETLLIILPYSVAVAVVGLLESLMTAQIVDDLTDTPSDKNQECIGQGIANIATGFIGGMAGCAMIGQSIINVKSGGRGRLSTFVRRRLPAVPDRRARRSGAADPDGGAGRHHDHGVDRHLLAGPRSSTCATIRARSSIVMLATVVGVVFTHNLAIGVLVGVLLSGIFFAWKIAQIFRVTSTLSDDGTAAHLRRRRSGLLRLGRRLHRRLRLQGSAGQGRSSTSAARISGTFRASPRSTWSC